MSLEDARETMDAWARSRGLAYDEHGLLPAATPALRRGLGVGQKRAGFMRSETDHSTTVVGGLRKWDERSSHNLCFGVLPGGVEGAIAHHVNLELRDTGGEGGQSWTAVPRTVVFAVLPEGSRPVRTLTGSVAGGGMKAGKTISLKRGDAVALPEGQRVERDGFLWHATPAEDPARLDRIIGPASAALAAAPHRTRVELQDGALCVVTRGIVTDAVALDALCAVAGAIAGGMVAVTSGDEPLDAATPIGAPAPSPRQQWLAEGRGHVTWSAPPVSVTEAQAAYTAEAEAQAQRRGVKGTVRMFALLAVAVLAAFDIAFFVVAAAVFPDAKGELLIAGFFSLLLIVPAGIRMAWRTGSEIHADEVATRALPWGLEAFAAEYAASRGLHLEDLDGFRHRFSSPHHGAPLRVMHGDLGSGVHGWLVLWTDDFLPQRTHRLLAVVAAPPGTTSVVASGYDAHVRDGLLVLGEPVSAEDRTVGRLDALRAAAVAAVAGAAVASQVG
ncbi:MAG: hypothetical protein JHC95_12785 [Solirubrobacteraceae bacterium]|nr:hypothetical protein [Solirubrobacteraceae bacterium]